ncbi:carbon-monoxide dehydrogenase large subunit [Tistlia consotensis]|uniref:Carbon-monoxide dehydrogenase large subunit n=1 Tax=Tistlia consotensis USBA 355 TaxID=560819 RepID=A0A1Y6B5C0_9PROT|nr:xanthine dehydrogenase family protein molybdopterin-binding subunit [Tistlia consotensis]SME90367.1 carbon-monoxide dehydrogenase large subunit [Tistlia consotensis USBA 355]SNR26671.1 carbon-monoxide dehydrogenase large subunit [Tistlia consotensis]
MSPAESSVPPFRPDDGRPDAGHPAAGRLEDRRLATGHGRYTADMAVPGMLHAAFVRSPYASARLAGLDSSAARALPGIVAVLTAADLAADGIAPFSVPMAIEGPGGRSYRQTPRPLLVGERVRFVGEPLALVVAETASAALDGAEAVAFELEPEPVVATLDQAARPDAPLLWDEAPGNLAYHWRRGDWQAVGAALRASHRVTRLEARVSRVSAAPMEPRGALAVPQPDGRTSLYASVQAAQGLKATLATMFGLEAGSIRVVAPDVGGSFGMKAGPLREECLVFWAARRLGRPLRWVAERGEALLSDEAGRDVRIVAELGLDGEGLFTALAVSMEVNVGAYASGRSTVPIMNIGGIAGVYRTPLIAGEVLGRFTNAAPTAPYRGAGRPDATFAVERVIDQAAREAGIDAFELRRRNLVPASAMPYRTPFIFTYDAGDFARTMELAAARADYAGFAARRAEAGRRGRLRGIGIANPIEVAGGPFAKPGQDFATLRAAADGTVTLYCGAMSAGQGLETAMIGLAAERLGLSTDRFRYVQGDSDAVPQGKGMGGSSAMTTAGSAVLRGVERLLEEGRQIAADELEAAAADLEYENGLFRIVGTDRVLSLAEVARIAERRAGDGAGGLAGQGDFTPGAPTYPNGCHICEVEIDPETGSCEVVSYVGVEDIGRVLFPQLAAGQVHGGVAQGLGQVLCEELRLDAEGQLLAGSFMDYAMPRAEDLPAYDCAFAETATGLNPLGVKGVGEAGTVGALAAGMNAVCDALASAGVERFDMPASPQRVWAALAAAKAASD